MYLSHTHTDGKKYLPSLNYNNLNTVLWVLSLSWTPNGFNIPIKNNYYVLTGATHHGHPRKLPEKVSSAQRPKSGKPPVLSPSLYLLTYSLVKRTVEPCSSSLDGYHKCVVSGKLLMPYECAKTDGHRNLFRLGLETWIHFNCLHFYFILSK